MKTKRHNDKNGYNPQTIPLKPNTRYVVSDESKYLFDAVLNKTKGMSRDEILELYNGKFEKVNG
jgi:hypothetical protein